MKVRKETATERTNEGPNECKNQDSNKPIKEQVTHRPTRYGRDWIEFENRLKNFDGIELTVTTGVFGWMPSLTHPKRFCCWQGNVQALREETLVRWKAGD